MEGEKMSKKTCKNCKYAIAWIDGIHGVCADPQSMSTCGGNFNANTKDITAYTWCNHWKSKGDRSPDPKPVNCDEIDLYSWMTEECKGDYKRRSTKAPRKVSQTAAQTSGCLMPILFVLLMITLIIIFIL
jgi:hypothetical protein